MYQQHMSLKLRKPILKYTLNKYHIYWLFFLKHLNLSISIKIPVTLLQIVYIYMPSKSPNVNYAFAKLVVAWLYDSNLSAQLHRLARMSRIRVKQV